ncbi:MAG: hypothetical protein LBC18_10910 [Opitutaceae bacterium]|nr:hypothetical protein [Opitutaceae bacterium]
MLKTLALPGPALPRAAAGVPQIEIPEIERMPAMPPGYRLRDWKQTARDTDAIAFDFNRRGAHLPLPWRDDGRVDHDLTGFALPAYVGDFRQTPRSNNYDAITCLGAVLGAGAAGIDKSNQHGRDWVGMLQIYYSWKNGTRLYLNNPGSSSGKSFWYELFPSILFAQIHSRHPAHPAHAAMRAQLLAIADRWREGCIALGASGERAPDFDHTAYNFTTGKPFDNPRWREPDAAAGVAWLELAAHAAAGDPRHLETARQALRFLDERRQNPFYEILLPYGVQAAARINAAHGGGHDTEKLFRWVFDGSNPRKWGVLAATWDGVPVHGLSGSVHPGHEYAFTMNSFVVPSALAPVARYDKRFARALGRWLLNVAANARHFYPDAWPPGRQTSWDWARDHDPAFALAYEGVRARTLRRERPAAETAAVGSIAGTLAGAPGRRPPKGAVLRPDSTGALAVNWRIDLPAATRHTFSMRFRDDRAPRALDILGATSPSGPWKKLLSVAAGAKGNAWKNLPVRSPGAPYYLRLEAPPMADAPKVAIDELHVNTLVSAAPEAGGDPTYLGWGATDIGLYGSVFAGLLGALVEPTDVEGILRIDCLATEAFPPPARPTWLLYNPHPETKTVTLKPPARHERHDVYEALSEKFLVRGGDGPITVSIPPDSAVLLVVCPPDSACRLEAGRLWCGETVIDYACSTANAPAPATPPATPPGSSPATATASATARHP